MARRRSGVRVLFAPIRRASVCDLSAGDITLTGTATSARCRAQAGEVRELPAKNFLQDGYKYIVSVGSVAASRLDNARATRSTHDEKHFEFKRVDTLRPRATKIFERNSSELRHLFFHRFEGELAGVWAGSHRAEFSPLDEADNPASGGCPREVSKAGFALPARQMPRGPTPGSPGRALTAASASDAR